MGRRKLEECEDCSGERGGEGKVRESSTHHIVHLHCIANLLLVLLLLLAALCRLLLELLGCELHIKEHLRID